MSKTIYDLDLHESLKVLDNATKSITVYKVPSGFIYVFEKIVSNDDSFTSLVTTSQFVPYEEPKNGPREVK